MICSSHDANAICTTGQSSIVRVYLLCVGGVHGLMIAFVSQLFGCKIWRLSSDAVMRRCWGPILLGQAAGYEQLGSILLSESLGCQLLWDCTACCSVNPGAGRETVYVWGRTTSPGRMQDVVVSGSNLLQCCTKALMVIGG
jgi:hypothetical protein